MLMLFSFEASNPYHYLYHCILWDGFVYSLEIYGLEEKGNEEWTLRCELCGYTAIK